MLGNAVADIADAADTVAYFLMLTTINDLEVGGNKG